MSTMDQVEDNLFTFTDFKPLSKEELDLVENVAAEIKKRTMNGCTGCAYCMPCPFGLDIPKNFKIWNELAKYGNKEVTKRRYFKEMQEEQRSSQCKSCGKCETLCPQHLSIRDDLKRMSEDMKQL